MQTRIVVLGGYGHFGGRICRALANDSNLSLVVAGRNLTAASNFVRQLDGAAANCIPSAIDYTAEDLGARLRDLRPNLVIHTSGPFQGQSYRVARATIEAGSHYVDLADGRAFVTGITTLDGAARDKHVVVTSGASTLPALSGAVIDHLRPPFARLESIAISIAPGQATPRGLATMEAILSYCGRPFLERNDGQWRRVYGWQGLRRIRYPDLGIRWAARCDVPDLELWPELIPTLRTVRFDAALENVASHVGLWSLAWLVRAGLVRRPEAFARTMLGAARRLDRLGTDTGGIHVRIEGILHSGVAAYREWQLTARNGHGPEIPCIPAIVLARKLVRGEPIAPGARPCLGMMTLDEFTDAVGHLDIDWRVRDEGNA